MSADRQRAMTWNHRKEAITNALPVPAPNTQRVDRGRHPCRARLEWEHSGEQWLDTHREAWTKDAILVHVPDPRLMVRGVWLPWHDVQPT